MTFFAKNFRMQSKRETFDENFICMGAMSIELLWIPHSMGVSEMP